MNFLQIVQRVSEKCGIARNTNITTAVGQSGKALELVNRVNEAWLSIQGEHRDWGWLHTATSFVTISGQATYTPTEAGATNFGMWDREDFRNYLTATGTAAEVFMSWLDYQAWRDIYQFSSNRTSLSQPYNFTITPAKAIGLGPVPPVGYTVAGYYWKAPTEMSLDSDIPSLPVHYHMAIVYRAMMLYAPSDAATEIYQEGEKEFARMMNRIEADYLPEITIGCD